MSADERLMTRESVMEYVCPEKDIVCGNRADNWCVDCPLKKSADDLDLIRKVIAEHHDTLKALSDR